MSDEVHGRESSTYQERMAGLLRRSVKCYRSGCGVKEPRSQPKAVITRRPSLDYPITSEQEHLWVLHQVDPNTNYFNHSHAYRLQGNLNIAAVRVRSMKWRVATRISVPRFLKSTASQGLWLLPICRFRWNGWKSRSFRWKTATTGCSPGYAHTCRPFDIVNGPLIRATLFRVTEHEHAVLITFHHIITDFVSYDLIDQEFFALYGAFSRGVPHSLPELTVQYGDFAFWLDQ